MAVPFQVLINDYSKQFYGEILSTIWFPIYRGLIVVFRFPIKFTTISLQFLGLSLAHTVFHTMIFLSQTAKSSRLLELRGATSKTVVSSTYFNLECQSPSTINHYSKKRKSKFSSLWNTTIGVAP